MVDNEIDRNEWFDKAGVLSESCYCGTHGSEIDEQWYAGEVLQQHARDDERNFFHAFAVRLPVGELAHVIFGDLLAVAVAQHGFEYNADAVGQARDWANPSFFKLW